ncbi:hypothetical protein AVEN_92374-1 [Araneus ventricosus]|uniref:Integrase zinc-binding domain-containing protein n=1 Tax=Araneus ventricosus TaxID=182803 RepID=A0A4Y2AH36_ARAVE|nr:hypothetical protein AVEN_92374-1 [Araneus ventricosus]
MLRSFLGSDTGLKLKSINLGTKVIYCDVSTGDIRPYVPKNFRSSIFQALHGLSHPGAKATLNLIGKRFVWKHMNKDIKLWCKSCIQCQRSKVNRHTKSALGEYELPEARFSHVYLDIVGPIPPSRDFVYVPTHLDRVFLCGPRLSQCVIKRPKQWLKLSSLVGSQRFGAPRDNHKRQRLKI